MKEARPSSYNYNEYHSRRAARFIAVRGLKALVVGAIPTLNADMLLEGGKMWPIVVQRALCPMNRGRSPTNLSRSNGLLPRCGYAGRLPIGAWARPGWFFMSLEVYSMEYVDFLDEAGTIGIMPQSKLWVMFEKGWPQAG